MLSGYLAGRLQNLNEIVVDAGVPGTLFRATCRFMTPYSKATAMRRQEYERN
jgi:hypothetical protein